MKRTMVKLSLGLVAVLAIFGCHDGEETPPPAQAEDSLILRRGNVDHVGIVESATMMLAGGPIDGILDSYNHEDPFAARAAEYRPTFAQRLAAFDAQDGKTDWSPENAAAWTRRMAAGNYLVVDTSKPCDFQSPHTYLEIERARLTGREHATCGGRMPNEDAFDVTLNFLVRGPAASAEDEDAWHDGVDSATQRSVPTFPYLAEMNGI